MITSEIDTTDRPESIVRAFEKAVTLMERVRMRRRRENSADGLAAEAVMRLQQAHYFLNRFRATELEHHDKDRALHHAQDPERQATLAKEINDLTTAIKALGEAFYYFAARAHKALEQAEIQFSARGVRHVRDHLIEHPTGSKGCLVVWWTFACEQGLVLNPGMTAGGNQIEDPGLYPNARQFVNELLPKLEGLARGESALSN